MIWRLRKKTLATLNSHSVLNLLQAAREKSLKVKYFEFRRKFFWKEGNENKIFNVVKNSASYPWKIGFLFSLSGNSNFLLFLNDHRGLTPPKKTLWLLKSNKKFEFQVKFLLGPKLKKKKRKIGGQRGFPDPLA